MEMRNGCVMRLRLWEQVKEGSKDFLPFIEIAERDSVKWHLMFGYILAEMSAGKGSVQWIEDGNKKVTKEFRCDCWTYVEEAKIFRISTLEEAQQVWEQKEKTENTKRRFKFSFRKSKKEETPALTLVRCERLGYALWNKEKGKVELYFIMTTKPEQYPKYSQTIDGTPFFAKGMVVITQE